MGRVLETWKDADDHVVLLAHGKGEVTVRYRAPGAPAARRGDLVRIAVEGDRALSVEIVASPTVPLEDAFRWRNAGGASRLRRLVERDAIVRSVRGYLHENEFLEVTTPLLVRGACPDRHLDSYVTMDGSVLVTSTEYQLKRLIVGGVDRIFSLTQNFRAGDAGDRHSPEFTMLEWARAWEDLTAIEQDAENLVREAAHAAGKRDVIDWSGHHVRIEGEPWERLSVREALGRHLGIDAPADFELKPLVAAAAKARVDVPPSFQSDRHYTISYLLDLLAPRLGTRVPTFLREWPAFMTSSTEASGSGLAERSELFIAGLEIADGFPFLRDSTRQAELFARERDRRRDEGRPDVPIDDRYVRALAEGIPPGAGMALGVDRLVMLVTDAPSIHDVLPFSQDEL